MQDRTPHDPLDENARRERSRRNVAMALALVAFVVLVFVVTIVKLSGNVAH